MSNYMSYTAEHYVRRCGSCPENEGLCTLIAADKCETYCLGEEPESGHLTVLSRSRQGSELAESPEPGRLMAVIAAKNVVVNPEYL
jgi:hypothetical protein